VVMNTLDSTVAACFVFSRKCIFPLFFSVAHVDYVFRLSVFKNRAGSGDRSHSLLSCSGARGFPTCTVGQSIMCFLMWESCF
jgi:hypothetical protein